MSFVIDDILAVEAGSLTSELTLSEQERISAILLSHGHYDHIRAVPSLAFNNPDHDIKILAIPETLNVLLSGLLNGVVYPNFAASTSYLGKRVLELCPLEPLQPVDVEGYCILPIPVRHPVPAVGFEISSKDGRRLFYTGVAKDAGHLCPQSLAGELAEFKLIRGYLPDCTLVHVTPQFEEEIREEVEKVAKDYGFSIAFASEGDVVVV